MDVHWALRTRRGHSEVKGIEGTSRKGLKCPAPHGRTPRKPRGQRPTASTEPVRTRETWELHRPTQCSWVSGSPVSILFDFLFSRLWIPLSHLSLQAALPLWTLLTQGLALLLMVPCLCHCEALFTATLHRLLLPWAFTFSLLLLSLPNYIFSYLCWRTNTLQSEDNLQEPILSALWVLGIKLRLSV